jgi:tetratricopeptide (TPR) repeat protein
VSVLRRAVLIVVIVAALLPEASRYAAERRLYRATAALQLLIAKPQGVPDPDGVLAWIASTALDASAALPGDWRPVNLAGSAYLVANQAGRALDTYRQALELGERPEIDFNLGRASMNLGRRESATTALLRAGWVSPATLSGLPREVRGALLSEIDRLEKRLLAGRLEAPPPLPLEVGGTAR